MLLLIPPPLPPHPSFILHSSATLPPSLGTPAAFSLPKDKHTFLLWCAPVRPNALNGFLLQVGIQNGNVKCVCSGFDVTTPGNSTTTWKQVCVKRLERLFENSTFVKQAKLSGVSHAGILSRRNRQPWSCFQQDACTRQFEIAGSEGMQQLLKQKNVHLCEC